MVSFGVGALTEADHQSALSALQHMWAEQSGQAHSAPLFLLSQKPALAEAAAGADKHLRGAAGEEASCFIAVQGAELLAAPSTLTQGDWHCQRGK